MRFYKNLNLYEVYIENDFLKVYKSLTMFPAIKITSDTNEETNKRVLLYDTGSLGGKFYVEYKIIDTKEFEQMILEEKVDLRGRYINDFDINSLFHDDPFEAEHLTFSTFNACLSYWEGGIDFTQAKFENCNVIFNFAHISGSEVSFNGASFPNCEINFSCVTFFDVNRIVFSSVSDAGKKIDFFLCKFGNAALYFNNVTAENTEIIFDTINFSQVTFNGCSINRALSFKKIVFGNKSEMLFTNVNSIVFEKCCFNSRIDIDGISNSIAFDDTLNHGEIYIDWSKNKLDGSVENAYSYISDKKERLEKINKDYLMLKTNYKNIGDELDEDYAHLAYSKNKTRLMKFGFKKLFYFMFEAICDYGINLNKSFYSCFKAITIFGAIFSTSILIRKYTFGFKYLCSTPWLQIGKDLLKGFYISLVSFFNITNRFSINIDLPLVKLLATIESVFGIILIGIFTVVLTRNMLRNNKK